MGACRPSDRSGHVVPSLSRAARADLSGTTGQTQTIRSRSPKAKECRLCVDSSLLPDSLVERKADFAQSWESPCFVACFALRYA